MTVKMKKKIVYVPMAADILHHGHINIINKARTLGTVVIGLYDDALIASYKRIPVMNLEKRKVVMESIKGVDRIEVQSIETFESILRKIKPDYVVHGDDWKAGAQNKMRQNIVKIIGEWGGKLVEPKYTKEISTTALIEHIRKSGKE